MKSTFHACGASAETGLQPSDRGGDTKFYVSDKETRMTCSSIQSGNLSRNRMVRRISPGDKSYVAFPQFFQPSYGAIMSSRIDPPLSELASPAGRENELITGKSEQNYLI